jgi:hypothetical protein
VDGLQVAVDVEPELVVAVGPGLDAVAHEGLRAPVDLARQGVEVGEPLVLEELPQPPRAHLMRPHDRPQVAQHHLGDAAVAADHLEQQRVLAPRLVELGRGHPHALREHVRRHDVAGVAAHVGDVGDGAQDRHHAAAVEHRRQHEVVRQVAVADPGVVGDQHVAGSELVERVAPQDRPRGPRDRDAEVGRAEARLAQGGAARIEQDAGEVAALADDRREGRLHRRGIDLVHDRDEPLPLDLQVDRADAGGVEHGGSSACLGTRTVLVDS